MSERLDESADSWSLRSWIMAAVAAAAGLIFHALIDHSYSEPLSALRQAAATFVAIATLSFVLTVEKRRWLWSVAFAAGWGVVIALVGWFTARYNVKPTIFEWPYWSGLLAVLIAAPLFQTIRDEGRWSLPYEKLHGHAWADAVIGGAGLAFTAITFLVSFLIGGLFDLIGIEAVKELLKKEWFDWMLAGAAFGAAVGLLREADRLLPVLQRVLRIVLAVIAPPLAVALVLFLASIPFTGLEKFWKSGIPATPLLLAAGANAILLSNTIFAENVENRSANPVLRWASLALVAVVLPLAGIAAMSMGQRIGEYGWTPERMWGVVAIAVAITYGLIGWWSIWKSRLSFDEPLRPLQTTLALGLCGLALFLALPILDFGAISARSQMARLESGKVKPAEFDWAAMAFDFGSAGRNRLAEIEKSGPADQRNFAKTALASDNRYSLSDVSNRVAQQSRLSQYLRILSPDIVVTDQLKAEITGYDGCNDKPCALLRLDPDHLVLVSNPSGAAAQSRIISLSDLAKSEMDKGNDAVKTIEGGIVNSDLSKAKIEIRQVERRQVYVDGKPVGDPIE
jgi:hypothetical protein